MSINQKTIMKIMREVKSVSFSSLYKKLKKDQPRLKKHKVRRVLSKLNKKSKINYNDGGKIIELSTTKNKRYRTKERTFSPIRDFDIIVKRYELKPEFSRDALNQAINLSKRKVELNDDRTDFTKQMAITIDGESAKDFDDAVYLEKKDNGEYVLYVHIADVSHYIREHSRLDLEAYERGNSFYLVDKVVPMLPKSMSNGICSLKPNVERYVVSVKMHLDNQGNIIDKDFYTGVIVSKRRCTYKEVENAIQSNIVDLSPDIQMIHGMLLNMKELADVLTERRKRMGSLELETKELEIDVDHESRPTDIHIKKRLTSERIIEEFMLMANVTVSEYLETQGNSLYRVHEAPDPENIDTLNKIIWHYDLHVDKNKELTPKLLQEILNKVKDREEKDIIHLHVLRTMKQAKYTPYNKGHFGLGFDSYTHFTSPIRRYPDLIVHRILKRRIGKKVKASRCLEESYLEKTAEHSSKTERVAVDAERDIIKMKSAHFMKDKIGEEYEGIISGVTIFGFFVEILPYGVEGLCGLRDLINNYEYDEQHTRLISEWNNIIFELGMRVKIKVLNVNIRKSFIDLIPVDEESYAK
jgi:ribonuclease R